MNGKRLYRCREDRQLAGVAGGMAEYLEIDPTIVRILWILSVFLGGFTLLLYLIMAFVVPLEPRGYAGPMGPNPSGPNPNAGWPNGWQAASSQAGTVDPTTAEAAAGDGTVDAAAPTATGGGAAGAGTGAGWTGPTYWTHGATATGWTPGPAHREPRSGGGSATMVFGILLVVFGGIALLGPLFPGWLVGAHLGPAFLVALGIALLAVALRRPAAKA